MCEKPNNNLSKFKGYMWVFEAISSCWNVKQISVSIVHLHMFSLGVASWILIHGCDIQKREEIIADWEVTELWPFYYFIILILFYYTYK